jgi:hypothetical protein
MNIYQELVPAGSNHVGMDLLDHGKSQSGDHGSLCMTWRDHLGIGSCGTELSEGY